MGMIKLGKVFSSVTKFIAPLAQTAIKAVAPQAAEAFKKILGDGFSLGKSALSTFMKALPLPSPLKSLAEKLLPKGMDLLQKLAEGGIDKLLAKIVGQPQPQVTADGVSVTTPGVGTPGRIDSIVNNTPAGGTSSSSGAATGSGASTVSGGPSSGVVGSGGNNFADGPPKASQFGDLSKPGNLEAYQAAQYQYQQMMSNINNFWTMMSNVFKSQSDTARNFAGNLR